MVYILDKINRELVKSEILLMEKETVPLKKNGWKFNWKKLLNEKSGNVYVLRTIDTPDQIEGALQLKIEFNMLIMNVLELAPYNIGKIKRYDYLAGCMIAFACRESFKLEGYYKGFLTFVSKTELIDWYMKKYGAELALGQRMYIDWENGLRLIEKYLHRTKID